MMKCVYVAGAYSSSNLIESLDNMRKGMKVAKNVLLAGFAPFCPWFDFHYALMLDHGEELFVHDYQTQSMAWLERSDAVLLVPGWERSKGTADELARAKVLNIPVFLNIGDLKNAMEKRDAQDRGPETGRLQSSQDKRQAESGSQSIY